MPCLTEQQIISAISLINQAVDYLNELKSPGSRFYELDAYGFLGGFLPCGQVPRSENDIAVSGERIEDLEGAIEILRSATPDPEPEPTPTPTPTPSPSPSTTEETCEQLVLAINNLIAKLDFAVIFENALNVFLGDLIIELTPFFDNIKIQNDEIIADINQITIDTEEIKVDIVNAVNDRSDIILRRIQDTRTELREARERLLDIESVLSSRFTEVLQRQNDTRIELREARERLLVIEACVCPRIEASGDLEVAIQQIIDSINASLDIKLNDLYNRVIAELKSQLSLLSIDLVRVINNPDWLSRVFAVLSNIESNTNTIIALLNKLDTIISLISQLRLFLESQFEIVVDKLNLVVDIANNIDVNLSLVFDLLREVDTNVSDLMTVTNTISDSTSVDLSQVIALLSTVRSEINQLAPPQITGIINTSLCESTISNAYSGSGIVAVAQEIALVSTQLNAMHLEICRLMPAKEPPELTGVVQTINCENPNNVIEMEYSGSGYQAVLNGLETLSISIINAHRDVCDNNTLCFPIEPTDVQEEFTIQKHLKLVWIEEGETDLKNRSKWHSTIPMPIDNLDWCTHFENVRWVKGNVTGRWYLNNSTSRLGGYFFSEQEAYNTLNQLIQLTTLTPKTALPRITKNNASFISREGLVTKIYSAALIEIVNGEPQITRCYNRPPQGC